MLKSIRLQNYESHEDSVFDLHPGINIIVGDSDKGKSGAMRGTCAVPTNKMFGIEHISHWCLTKTDEIKAGKEARVTWDKGDVQISRVRSAKMNGYELSTLEKPLEAIRTEIPSVVLDALNITDVNIQRQLDGPFLIGRPPGEVARFINKLVRLDDIDLFISAAKERVKKNKDAVEVEVEEIKKLDSSLLEYEWIDKIAQYVDEIKTIESELPKLETQAALIVTELEQHAEALRTFNACSEILKAEPFVQEARRIDLKIAEKQQESALLDSELKQYAESSLIFKNTQGIIEPAQKLLDEAIKIDKEITLATQALAALDLELKQYQKAQEIIKASEGILEAERLIEEAKKITLKITSKLDEVALIDREIILYNKAKADMLKLDKEIEALVASRPKICPTCGQPLLKCKD